MKRLIAAAALLVALCGCSPAACSRDPAALRILFVGNSYTYVNDLPATFAQLACSGGHRVETGMQARPGWALDDHVSSPQTLDVLENQPWDIVVLQEQSEVPSIEAERAGRMYPAGRALVGRIRASGAEPVLFLTWAHRDGMPGAGYADFEAMQAGLDAGYEGLAGELGVRIVPVGDAWRAAAAQSAPLTLWDADGSHPGPQGTYLAACVFYAAIIGQSPEGLAYHADLPEATARILQSLAAGSVPETAGQ